MSIDELIAGATSIAVNEALEEALPRLLARVALPIEDERALSYEQAADMLGVPVATIEARVQERDLTRILIGRHARITVGEIRRFIRNQEAHERTRNAFARDQHPTTIALPETDDLAALMGETP